MSADYGSSSFFPEPAQVAAKLVGIVESARPSFRQNLALDACFVDRFLTRWVPWLPARLDEPADVSPQPNRTRLMTRPASKDERGRRDGILDAAGETFIRYGFRKTSMDDVARAAGLSRQSLYAHFPNKEALFRDVVQHLVAATREASRAALAREDADLEARLLDSFDAMYGSALSDEGSGHLNELFAAAEELTSDAVRNLERAIVADLARVFRDHAVGAAWQKKGMPSTMLADHLYTLSTALKHRGVSRAEYRERMRTAVRIVCRGAGAG